MIPFEEIKKYLPQHLSSTAEQELFNELKAFPHNIDQRLYTTYLHNHTNLFQGDGIQNLLYIHFPDTNVDQVPGMILSNTCDIDQANKRLMPLRMVYAPIINLGKYEQSLIKNHVDTDQRSIESINSHIADIRKQHISHIFYLPKGGQLENDSIVFFDRTNNCPANLLEEKSVIRQRIFTLSDYGFYLFLFKLSVHFTRIRNGVSRTSFRSYN
ncbi:MAG: hypothetical protein SRB1_00276 [Desulfobacteraceae bacterium Eth-SRB1]|nr:MAG: hypothetical protein SRB1_00276 [Desulfobacteraceae bacterium Eth-SRB1]